MDAPPPTKQQLLTTMLIRFALFSGVVLFGIVSFVVHQNTTFAYDHDTANLLRPVFYGVAAVAIVVAFVMRRKAFDSANFQEQSTRSLIAWSLGEAAALVGGIIFFLGGDSRYWLLGLMLIAATYVIVPMRRPA